MKAEELNARIPYATDEELEILRHLASQLTPLQNVVMIGAGPGVMLMALREGNPSVPITLVDIQTCRYAQLHLAEAGLDNYVSYVVSDSYLLGMNFWGTTPVDLLVIDGNHSYYGVKRDIEAWLPKLAFGGHVFIHDFDARGTRFEGQEQYPGVAQAVADSDIMRDEFTHVGRYGTAVVLRRDG